MNSESSSPRNENPCLNSGEVKAINPIITKANPDPKNSPVVLFVIHYSHFYSQIKLIIIPLNTISSISRIHLVYAAARGCVKTLTCVAVIPNCSCCSIRNPDHPPQVISYGGFTQ